MWVVREKHGVLKAFTLGELPSDVNGGTNDGGVVTWRHAQDCSPALRGEGTAGRARVAMAMTN